MYIPTYHRVNDLATAVAFMKAHPFAVVVSASDASPFATHIPVLVQESGGQVSIRGHVAKANPHWQLLEKAGETLVIFHGPHAYVSPRLYESRESVPTWNYAAVHAYGSPNLIADAGGLAELLEETIRAFDSGYLEQWSELSENTRARMLAQIVGFEMRVARLEAKFKLSQNRPQGDQQRVMECLAASSDSAAVETAQLLKEYVLGQRSARNRSK